MSRNEGFVLVAVIWIIAILTVLTLGFAGRALIDQRAAAVSLDQSCAQYLARGSVRYAVADMRNRVAMEELLQQIRERAAAANVPQRSAESTSYTGTFDLMQPGKVFETSAGEGGNRAGYSVTDEEGRISINTAPEEILDNIEGLSFQTVNDIMRRRGGELSPEDRELFLTVEEVRFLDGVDEGDWVGLEGEPGLRELFTVYGEGRINVNSASREVLLALPDIDEGTVDAIIAYRHGNDRQLGTSDDRGFSSIEQISAVTDVEPTALAPITRYCTVRSQFFRISGFATQRQGRVRAGAEAVVQLLPGGAAVLAWSEGEIGPQNPH